MSLIDFDLRQCAINLFGYYDVQYDEITIQLFLTLGVLDNHGNVTCTHTSYETPWPVIYNNVKKCDHYFQGKDHNKDVCQAFEDFCHVAEDPLVQNHERELLRAVVTFRDEHLLCEEHRLMDTSPLDLLDKVKACRNTYLFTARCRSPRPDDSYIGLTPSHSRQKSRLSKFLPSMPRKSVDFDFTPLPRRERSPSPFSFEYDGDEEDDDFILKRAGSGPKRMSSAPNMKRRRPSGDSGFGERRVATTPMSKAALAMTKLVKN